MNNIPRTENVTKNMIIGLLCQMINLVMNFAVRTAFIRTLGAEYLGVNGLFTNILTVLSFAELGIGNAMIYSLYRPLAEVNLQRLGSLMKLYQKSYRIIGTVVFSLGLLVIPFLNLIIKDSPSIPENLALLYFLFLLNTSVSYFFTYKKSIITADQRNYIVLIIDEAVKIIQIIAQIVLLYFSHNYILYLIIQILGTISTNLISAFVANKLYPFLKNDAPKLSKEDSLRIFKNIKALAVYKFGSVILNGTDNILVSVMDRVVNVGKISNYVLLTTSCTAILGRITNAFTASVGNLNSGDETEKQYDVFQKLFFITAWLFGFASVGLYAVSRPLIIAWLGEDYIIDNLTEIAIIVGFYVNSVHQAAYTYRTTLGFFVQGQIAPVLAAFFNIFFSILFYKWMGLCGIFFATPIARILSTGIVDPVLIYRRKFKKSSKEYYIRYLLYALLFASLGIICKSVVSFITIGGWLGVIIDFLIVTFIFNGAMFYVFSRTRMFKEVFNNVKSIVQKYFSKNV